MKSILVATVIAGTIFAGCNNHINESRLPSVVVNSVKSKYTSSEKIEWEKWSNGYVAEFYLGNRETKVYVDSAGNILMQKQEIKNEELPPVVTAVIANSYKDYKIDEADKLEKDANVYYQVELDGNGSNKDIELVFTAHGKPATGMSYWK